MTNACKFGRGAPVRVQASLRRGADGQTSLQVTVRDTGRGMTAAEAANCFVSQQAAPAAAGGGTGLGLYSAPRCLLRPLQCTAAALTRRAPAAVSSTFAHLMGGVLSVQSEQGKGSTFELCVPVRVLPPEEEAAAVEVATAAIEVETAALEAAEESQLGRAASFAAVASAAAARGDALDAGAQGSPRRCFHALVADDYALNLRLITWLLQMHDFSVTAVGDGAAALAALLSSFAPPSGDAEADAQQRPFDVVVLGAPPLSRCCSACTPTDTLWADMNMPFLRGPEVAAKFRDWEAKERPHAMKLPIIALTANVLEEHAAECADAGCVARHAAWRTARRAACSLRVRARWPQYGHVFLQAAARGGCGGAARARHGVRGAARS